MRKNKFKVWDSKANAWFEPVYRAFQGELREMLLAPSGDLMLRTMDSIEHCDSLYPNRYIIVFFTGLKDKNGKDIFEGDVLINKSGRICEIIWNEYTASFDAKPLNNIGTTRGYTYNRQWAECEVIGDIHTTPDYETS